MYENIPEIAIMGHPNEGKSSVLSTLAEDDSVKISPMPGETTCCRTFPVSIDGQVLLRFTDTPGFQNPSRVLAELRKLANEEGDCVMLFRQKFATVPELAHDVELLAPLERGAGLIYVVDASRPIRNVDKSEMEILRLSGRTRMAVVNCKNDGETYLEAWKNAFRRNFNANRIFNAHRATYVERIALLEALTSVDQDWQQVLDEVVAVLKVDWQRRNRQVVSLVVDLLEECLAYTIAAPFEMEKDMAEVQDHLMVSYRSHIGRRERRTHDAIRTLFKHHAFSCTLPENEFLAEELFSEKTWQLMGLSKVQLAVLGGLGGATLGAGVDLAAGGALLGLVTGIGGVAGVIGALAGGAKLSATRVMGLRVGGEKISLGPARDINLLFILLNRALLFYVLIQSWAHGRRDYEVVHSQRMPDHVPNLTAGWSAVRLRIARSFFRTVTGMSDKNRLQHRQNMIELLLEVLAEQDASVI